MSVFNSILNLINTNNGQFKSIKQSCFMKSESVGGIISISGSSFDKNWVDMFELNDSGIVAWQRHNYVRGQLSSVVEKWNNEGTAVEQVKAVKRVDKHNAKLAAHEAIVGDAEAYYNELCIEAFGYVPCSDKRDLMHSLLQKSQSTDFVYDFIMETLKTGSAIDEFAVHWSSAKDQTAKLLEQYSKDQFTLLDIRVKVQTRYSSNFQFTFM